MFTSLITEKKFIDTVKDFTIFVESIDEYGNMKNIYLKDSINKVNTQIITAKSGKIIEDGAEKFLHLNFGQILDITNNNFKESKVIKFNDTIFNLSNFKTKSTTFPKLQELESKTLIECINNYLIGNKEKYSLPYFHCSEDSAVKGGKEIFDRSIKQIYILIIGLLASILIFINEKNPKYSVYRILIFFIGICLIVLSEINSQFLSFSVIKNTSLVLLPSLILFLTYICVINLNKRNI